MGKHMSKLDRRVKELGDLNTPSDKAAEILVSEGFNTVRGVALTPRWFECRKSYVNKKLNSKRARREDPLSRSYTVTQTDVPVGDKAAWIQLVLGADMSAERKLAMIQALM